MDASILSQRSDGHHSRVIWKPLSGSNTRALKAMFGAAEGKGVATSTGTGDGGKTYATTDDARRQH